MRIKDEKDDLHFLLVLGLFYKIHGSDREHTVGDNIKEKGVISSYMAWLYIFSQVYWSKIDKTVIYLKCATWLFIDCEDCYNWVS